MKFFHISDLHIGRQLNYYNLNKIQKEVLSQVVEHMKQERPDALLISGDIYDRSIPSGEAYQLFNDFLDQLGEIEPAIPVLIIAGNHDSQDRLNFASSFLEKHQIYIEVYPPRSEEEHLRRITLKDADGEVDFYLLPFVRPALVRHLFPEGECDSFDAAVRGLIEREEIDHSRRNVLLSHQFYISGSKAPKTCESEMAYISVGGLDSVDISAIDQFDYAALGHIHGKQQVGLPKIRYCGTPYKYSVSEEHHNKSITVVTLGKKGEEVGIEEIPFTFSQDVRKITGTLKEVIAKATEENCHDFVSIVLTDEEPQFKAKEKLEEYYDQILDIRVENKHMQQMIYGEERVYRTLEPLEAFQEFYRQRQGGQDMSADQIQLMQEIISKVRGEE